MSDVTQLTTEELGAERERGRMAGYFALLSAALTLGTLVAQYLTLKDEDLGDKAKLLLSIDAHPLGWMSMKVLAAIATAALAPLLIHLALAARSRLPAVPRMIQTLALLGPLLVAIALPLQQVLTLGIAKDFADAKVQTVAAANDELNGVFYQLAAGLGLAGVIALAFAFVMVGWNGIKTGLLTRFVGAVAMIIGFATVIPVLGAASILQFFWLCAMTVMLIGPDERKPPAWAAGRMVPWPKFGQAPDAAKAGDGDEALEVIDAESSDTPDEPEPADEHA